jgi:hypothetical protein
MVATTSEASTHDPQLDEYTRLYNAAPASQRAFMHAPGSPGYYASLRPAGYSFDDHARATEAMYAPAPSSSLSRGPGPVGNLPGEEEANPLRRTPGHLAAETTARNNLARFQNDPVLGNVFANTRGPVGNLPGATTATRTGIPPGMEAAAASNPQYVHQQSNGYSFDDQTEQLREMYGFGPSASPTPTPPALARPIVDYSQPPSAPAPPPTPSTPLVVDAPGAGSPLAAPPPRSVPLVVEPPVEKSTPFSAAGAAKSLSTDPFIDPEKLYGDATTLSQAGEVMSDPLRLKEAALHAQTMFGNVQRVSQAYGVGEVQSGGASGLGDLGLGRNNSLRLS